MANRKHKGISVVSAQVTATVSVTLVLVLLGVLATLGTVTHSITENIRENLGFNIILTDSLDNNRVDVLCRELDDTNYIKSHKYVSAEDALDGWRAMTGEDLMEILDVNPFSSTIEVKVMADYANVDSIAALARHYSEYADVERVEVPSGLVESISKSINSLTFVLTGVALLLLLISFVLINNTVHLTVYARRFTIHTMQLVGATDGFIRRPFLFSAAIAGFIASVVANVLLFVMIYYSRGIDPEVSALMEWSNIAWVFGLTTVCGVVINTLATMVALHKYLRKQYDEMFS